MTMLLLQAVFLVQSVGVATSQEKKKKKNTVSPDVIFDCNQIFFKIKLLQNAFFYNETISNKYFEYRNFFDYKYIRVFLFCLFY